MTSPYLDLELLGSIERTVTDSELAAVSLRAGFELPASYCAFVQHYGYGLLGNRLLFFTPITDYSDDELSLRSRALQVFFAECVADELFEYEPDGTPELIGELIPFGISEDGHYLAWRATEPTAPNEYAIYVIGSKCLSVTRAADDLFQLLNGCFERSVKRILGPGYEPLPRTFRPARSNRKT